MTEALPSEGRIHMGTSRTGMRKAGGGGDTPLDGKYEKVSLDRVLTSLS